MLNKSEDIRLYKLKQNQFYVLIHNDLYNLLTLTLNSVNTTTDYQLLGNITELFYSHSTETDECLEIYQTNWKHRFFANEYEAMMMVILLDGLKTICNNAQSLAAIKEVEEKLEEFKYC